MKRSKLPIAPVIAALALSPLISVGDVAANDRGVQPPVTNSDKVARGKYLVTTAGCNDCHTPFKVGPNGAEPDMTRMLSGHPEQLVMPPAPTLPEGPWLVVASGTNTAHAGPWGVSFTANLTPDRETGLGKWTLRTFSDTIRTGRHMGRGRESCPRCRSACTRTSTMQISKRSSRICSPYRPSAIGCRNRDRLRRRVTSDRYGVRNGGLRPASAGRLARFHALRPIRTSMCIRVH